MYDDTWLEAAAGTKRLAEETSLLVASFILLVCLISNRNGCRLGHLRMRLSRSYGYSVASSILALAFELGSGLCILL